jgi:hypothetical protein
MSDLQRNVSTQDEKEADPKFTEFWSDRNANGWESIPSAENMFETYKAGFLHETDLMYGYQYGVDLDEFCGQIDPLKQFKMMKEIGTTGMIQTCYDNDVCILNLQKKAYIAAAQMSNSLPFGMDPSLSVDELSKLKLTSKEMAELTCKCSIYFTNMEGGIPIVIDMGASMSVSPCEDNFIGRGSKQAPRESVATVCWMIREVFGSVRVIKT